jgi:hypothetical protein
MPRATIVPARSVDIGNTTPWISLHELQILHLRKADAATAESQTTSHRSAYRSLCDLSGHLVHMGQNSTNKTVVATAALRARCIGHDHFPGSMDYRFHVRILQLVAEFCKYHKPTTCRKSPALLVRRYIKLAAFTSTKQPGYFHALPLQGTGSVSTRSLPLKLEPSMTMTSA